MKEENKALYKRKETHGRFELWGNDLGQYRIWRSGVIIREGGSEYISSEWFNFTGNYPKDNECAYK